MVSTGTSYLIEQPLLTILMHFVQFRPVSVAVTLSLPLRVATQGAGVDGAVRCSRSLGSETGPLLGRLQKHDLGQIT